MPKPEVVELPLSGRLVFRVVVSGGNLRLEFLALSEEEPELRSEPDYSLIIEGPFRLTSGDEALEIDPAMGPHPAYLRPVDKRVQRATAYQDGSLRVEFADGDLLSVPPFKWEPWQLERLGGDGMSVISIAGGGLSVSGGDHN